MTADRWPQAAGRAFERPQMATGQPLDLYETAENLILEMVAPGVEREDIHLSIEGNDLVIRSAMPEPDLQEEYRCWARSIPRGEFSQTLTLPTRVVADEVEARLRDGVLRLVLPKAPESRARKITVN